MDILKTVEGQEVESVDPLRAAKNEDVAKMRASLLACSDDPTSAVSQFQKITYLRLKHQLARIIKYTELMDRLEETLYDAIDGYLVNADVFDPLTMTTLLNVQDRLLENMNKSHELLKPYLTASGLPIEQFVPVETVDAETSLISRETRDKLRESARKVLEVLDGGH